MINQCLFMHAYISVFRHFGDFIVHKLLRSITFIYVFFSLRAMLFLYYTTLFALLIGTVYTASISVSGNGESGSASASGNGFGCTVVNGKKHCVVSKEDGRGGDGGGGSGSSNDGGGGGGGGGGGSGGGWGGGGSGGGWGSNWW